MLYIFTGGGLRGRRGRGRGRGCGLPARSSHQYGTVPRTIRRVAAVQGDIGHVSVDVVAVHCLGKNQSPLRPLCRCRPVATTGAITNWALAWACGGGGGRGHCGHWSAARLVLGSSQACTARLPPQRRRRPRPVAPGGGATLQAQTTPKAIPTPSSLLTQAQCLAHHSCASGHVHPPLTPTTHNGHGVRRCRMSVPVHIRVRLLQPPVPWLRGVVLARTCSVGVARRVVALLAPVGALLVVCAGRVSVSVMPCHVTR